MCPVQDVEDALVGHPPPQRGEVVGVPPLPEVDVVAGVGLGVGQETPQEGDGAVALAHQDVPQLVRHGQRAQRAHGVREEGVGAVEGVDVAGAPPGGDGAPSGSALASVQRAPAPPGDLEGRLSGAARDRPARRFAGAVRHPPLAQQAPQGAVGGDVVKAVVVHAHVGDVGGHHLQRPPAPDVQELLVPGGVELQQGRAELEPLRPLRPAPGGVAPRTVYTGVPGMAPR